MSQHEGRHIRFPTSPSRRCSRWTTWEAPSFIIAMPTDTCRAGIGGRSGKRRFQTNSAVRSSVAPPFRSEPSDLCRLSSTSIWMRRVVTGWSPGMGSAAQRMGAVTAFTDGLFTCQGGPEALLMPAPTTCGIPLLLPSPLSLLSPVPSSLSSPHLSFSQLHLRSSKTTHSDRV